MGERIGPDNEQIDNDQIQPEPKFVVGESGTVYQSTTVSDELLGTADHVLGE